MQSSQWPLRSVYGRALLGCLAGMIVSVQSVAAAEASPTNGWFRIQVVDEQTGRGVPMVELKTTGNLVYITDSSGIAAICEPGMTDQMVFFHVSSHGYEFPKDGFGYRGTALRVTPGGTETIRLKRLNIAERLYRVTGQGIYRDSLLTGDPVPLAQPVLNAQITGQDSAQNCIYRGKLYWFWGDTGRLSYPLGHFATAGATSLLPGQGGLDPDRGVDLTYWTDASGFSRPVARMSEPGLVWIQAVMTAKDPAGKERLLIQYSRLKSMSEILERGLMVFNDDSEQFEPLLRGEPQCWLFNDLGHPLSVRVDGRPYYYFATPFPLAVRMRVRTDWQHITDPNRYEVFTALHPETPDQGFRWCPSDRLLARSGGDKAALIKALKKEKDATATLTDIETGDPVIPHNGSVYWNNYWKQWVMIAVQQGGRSSYLGEVWIARADTPVGPWHYARKIITHNAYSFYNPKQHPYFDQDNGRLIYLEGTYTYTFSGKSELATPRYDYNQIMYRLDLSDPRLDLPKAASQVGNSKDRTAPLLTDPSAQPDRSAPIQ